MVGLAGVVTGHPFDTVKVRLQSFSSTARDHRPAYQNTLQTFTTIIRNETFRGLYKGMVAPMAGVVTINALLFGLYGFLLDVQQRGSTDKTATMLHIFWAGFGSGLGNSLISCPTELAKIQLQNQVASCGLGGPLSCLREIVRREGFGGCFRGMVSTVLRRRQATACTLRALRGSGGRGPSLMARLVAGS